MHWQETTTYILFVIAMLAFAMSIVVRHVERDCVARGGSPHGFYCDHK